MKQIADGLAEYGITAWYKDTHLQVCIQKEKKGKKKHRKLDEISFFL